MTVKPGQTVKEEQVEGKYGNDKNKLVPTSMGMLVNGFLSEHFPGIIDYDFTAGIEEQFDTIASGTLKWPHMVNEFYLPFHMRVKEIDETVTKGDAGGVRELGIDPTSGKIVYARFGKFGPVIQLGESNGGKDEKPKFAPFPRGKTIETVTLEDALPMLLLPRVVGKISNDAIEASIGPKGPYIRHGKHYVSISYDELFKITEKEAIDRIAQNKVAKKQSVIKSFPGSNIIVKKGRYGPYVADGKINASIPKSIKPGYIDLKKAQELLENKKNRKKRKV
jgi:DNA topoisomerase-1